MSKNEDIEAAWLEQIESLSQEELAELARRTAAAHEVSKSQGPKTPEELDAWFRDVVGEELPKVAVCPGHSAPFDVACEIYFYKVLRILIIANRGGAKTSTIARLHVRSAESYPGYQGLTGGASGKQAGRCYEHILPFVVEGGVPGGKELSHVQRCVETKTEWKSGSSVEYVLSSINSMNGPRVPRLHRDEVELMEDDIYSEAGNIPAGKKAKDGRYMPAQIIDTSTMKWAHGRVAKQKTEYEEALRKGLEPPRQVRIWCIYEVAEEVPNCRSAPQEEREARLTELGRDPCELCNCNKVVKGTWDEDSAGKRTDRTLESACAGRLFRSRGFKTYDDVKTLFLENERRTWEAQQECSKPSGEGVYVESFSRVRHGIKNYIPDPINGPIYLGVDWGGTDQHSVGWYQRLDHDLEIEMHVGERNKVAKKGTLIRFAEIFLAGIGNVKLGEMCISMEDGWRARWPGWVVKERYPDSANAAGILDWKHHLGLICVSRIKKDFEEQVRYVNDWVDDVRLLIDIEKCPMMTASLEAWHAKNGHEVHDWSSHPAAELRYVLHNLNVIDRNSGVSRNGSDTRTSVPAADESRDMEPARNGRKRTSKVIIGPAGAEDSPHRSESRRMQGHPLRRDL